MIRTRTALTACSLLVALALGACSGDDPQPKFADPSPTVASTPSTVNASADPEASNPVETFRSWVEARNAALHTGDTSAVEELSAPTCKTCQAAIEPVRTVFAQGGHFDTKGWIVTAARLKNRSASRAEVSAALKYAAGETVPVAGEDPVSYSVERHVVVIKLTSIDGRWLVQYIGYLS